MISALRQIVFVPLILIPVWLSCNWYQKCATRIKKIVSEYHTENQSDTICIAAYNVENLFDFNDDGKEYPLYKPGLHNWTYQTYSKKLSHIASVLASLNADMYILSEIENSTVAEALQKELKFHKRNYPYYATGENPNPATTCQVLLSKYPIVKTRGHGIPKIGRSLTRNILEADVQIGSEILKIFAVHFPSKWHPESHRIAAAQVLIQRIDELPRGTDYIIAGDFNSNYDEAASFFTEGFDDTQGITAINHILKTVQSKPGELLDYVTEYELQKYSNKGYHYTLWLEHAEQERFCYYYKGKWCTPDHFLLPAALYDTDGISYVDNSFFVYTWYGKLLLNAVPYRWKINYGKNGQYHCGRGYSDHLPIAAKFIVGPFTPAQRHADATVHTVSTANTIRSFETGYEGWMPYSAKYRFFLDTLEHRTGRFSLKIEGLAHKNLLAGKIRLPLNCKNDNAEERENQTSSLTFSLKGKGTIAFRMRMDSSDGVWYHGSKFELTARRAVYTSFAFHSWQTVTLPLPAIPDSANGVVLELYSARDSVLCIWFDDIEIKEYKRLQ